MIGVMNDYDYFELHRLSDGLVYQFDKLAISSHAFLVHLWRAITVGLATLRRMVHRPFGRTFRPVRAILVEP